jgi:hypothetical protein
LSLARLLGFFFFLPFTGGKRETGWLGILASGYKESIGMSTSTLEQSRLVLALRRSPIPALRKLSLEETENAVTIQGRVSSYYLKQLAQETILPLLEGRALHNRVQVVTELLPQNI